MGRDDRVQPRPGALPRRRDDGGAARGVRRALHGDKEVDRSIDRFVWYAGWADKLPQVLGGANPVAGPVLQLHGARSRRAVGVLAPDDPPLAVSCRGSRRCSSAATQSSRRLRARPLGCDRSSPRCSRPRRAGRRRPNILTGHKEDLAPWLAGHMDVNAIDVTGATGSCPTSSARRRERQARRPRPSRRPEPLADRRLPRAEDRLAPDRPLGDQASADPSPQFPGRPRADSPARRLFRWRGGLLGRLGRAAREAFVLPAPLFDFQPRRKPATWLLADRRRRGSPARVRVSSDSPRAQTRSSIPDAYSHRLETNPTLMDQHGAAQNWPCRSLFTCSPDPAPPLAGRHLFTERLAGKRPRDEGRRALLDRLEEVTRRPTSSNLLQFALGPRSPSRARSRRTSAARPRSRRRLPGRGRRGGVLLFSSSTSPASIRSSSARNRAPSSD